MTEDILNDVVDNFNDDIPVVETPIDEPEEPQKTEKEIADKVVNALATVYPQIEEVADLRVSENGKINIEIKDFIKFNIPVDLYNGDIFQGTEYINEQKKLVIDIYEKVSDKCNESKVYEIFYDNVTFKVIKTAEREDYNLAMMTEEEKAEYNAKKKQDNIDNKRMERDNLLVTVVDPIVTNPLRWAELSAEEQEAYKQYRLYLLDIPQRESFPDIDILSFEDFKNTLNTSN